MAFNCDYDSALTNLTITEGNIILSNDFQTIVDAVNELKGYLDGYGGYSVTTSNIDCGSNDGTVQSEHVTSIRTISDQIDPTANCPCDWYGTATSNSSSSDCIDATLSWSDGTIDNTDLVDNVDFQEIVDVFNEFQEDLKRNPEKCGCDNNCTCNSECSCVTYGGCSSDCSTNCSGDCGSDSGN